MTQQHQEQPMLEQENQDNEFNDQVARQAPGAEPENDSSLALMAVSPGKRPLSQTQLKALFGSVDGMSYAHGSEDLSMIYASADSIATKSSVEFWQSKDISSIFLSSEMPPLKSAGGSTMSFDSIDAAEGMIGATDLQDVPQEPVYASIDPLPWKVEEGTTDTKVGEREEPGIYESRDWLGMFEGSHVDVTYGKEMFVTTEPAPRKRSKWEDEYYSSLQVPDAHKVAPATKPSKVKPSSKKATPKKQPGGKRGEPREKIYVEPLAADIISGRGGKSNSWPGNERYREIIETAKPAYRDGAKFEKTIKSQEVVEILLAEGRRFLKLEETGPHEGDYYIMTKNQARKKAGQALREENTPESRKRKREFYANRTTKQKK